MMNMKTRNQKANIGKIVLLGAAIFTLGVFVACDSETDGEEVTDNVNDSISTDIDIVQEDSLNYEVDTTIAIEDSMTIE